MNYIYEKNYFTFESFDKDQEQDHKDHPWQDDLMCQKELGLQFV